MWPTLYHISVTQNLFDSSARGAAFKRFKQQTQQDPRFFLSLFGLHNYVFQNCPLQQYARYMSHVNQVEFFADPITH